MTLLVQTGRQEIVTEATRGHRVCFHPRTKRGSLFDNERSDLETGGNGLR
jgi:hypothetical protein